MPPQTTLTPFGITLSTFQYFRSQHHIIILSALRDFVTAGMIFLNQFIFHIQHIILIVKSAILLENEILAMMLVIEPAAQRVLNRCADIDNLFAVFILATVADIDEVFVITFLICLYFIEECLIRQCFCAVLLAFFDVMAIKGFLHIFKSTHKP